MVQRVIIPLAMSFDEFAEEWSEMGNSINKAGLDIVLGDDTVAKTIAHRLYWDWFNDNNADVADHYTGYDIILGEDDDGEVEEHGVELQFHFHEEDKNLALMFKLAHG